MAKRYFTYSDLNSYQVNTPIKPGGTLGNHHLLVISHNPLTVRGINSQGKETRTVQLKSGWNLGYDCGKVWVVRPAAEIEDPLLRIMRELKIPSRALVTHDDEIRIFSHVVVCGAGHAPQGNSIQTFGDGWSSRYQAGSPEWYEKWDTPHPDEGRYYSGGEFAIVTDLICDYNGYAHSKVSAVVLRPGVSHDRAAELWSKALESVYKKQSNHLAEIAEFQDLESKLKGSHPLSPELRAIIARGLAPRANPKGTYPDGYMYTVPGMNLSYYTFILDDDYNTEIWTGKLQANDASGGVADYIREKLYSRFRWFRNQYGEKRAIDFAKKVLDLSQ